MRCPEYLCTTGPAPRAPGLNGLRRFAWGASLFAALWLAPAAALAQGACPSGFGDITEDGNVNVTDVQCSILVTLWTLGGMGGAAPPCAKAPEASWDINCDGAISIQDIQLLISMVLGSALGPQVDANADGCPDACELEPEGCPGAMPIACGDVITGTTVGGSTIFDNYSCQTWNESGPEAFYALMLTEADQVQATLSNLGGNDLDIFLLGADCNNEECIAAGNTTIEASLEAGTYFIAIDGFLGDEGSFTLTVNCASTCDPVALCQNVECGSVTCFGQTFDCGGCGAGETCIGGTCEAPDSCAGSCGTDAGNCWCDSSCFSFGDCCPDVCTFCPDINPSACLEDCGDGMCDPAAGENCSTCVADCGCEAGDVCNAGTCEPAPPENCCASKPGPGCASDLDCEDCVCAADSFCCGTAWDGICAGIANNACNSACQCNSCGDGICDPSQNETCSTCAADCACAPGQLCNGGVCGDAAQCDLSNVLPIGCFAPVQGTTVGGPSAIDNYNCVGWNQSGPEAVYEFVATATGTVQWTFSNEPGVDLDVFVLSPNCDQGSCIAFAGTNGSFSAVEGETYYVIVDGFEGDEGSFNLALNCPLTACGDGTCNAAGGENCTSCPADCGCPSGEFCQSGSCNAIPTCDFAAPPAELTCGDIITGSTTGGPSAINQYNCVSWNESGPENYFVFTAPANGNITATLSNLSADMDVFILNPLCNAESCKAHGNTTAATTVMAGETYYVVVDGFNGANGAYTLTFACDFTCGNGMCDSGENCTTCPADCGCPVGEVCTVGTCGPPPPENCCASKSTAGCASNLDCEDCVCDADPFCCNNSWDSICANRANGACNNACMCTEPTDCGDGICDAAIGENCATCAADCACGSGEVCNAGICEDAPPEDCCASKSTAGCAANIGCEDCVCVADPFCCNNSWDSVCANRANGACNDACQCNDCGNGTCDAGETCSSCPSDCGCPQGEFCQLGACTSGTACADDPAPTPIACGEVVQGNTTGGPSVINNYNCQTWNESGPENIYIFTATVNGSVTVALSGMSVDLDIFVLGGSCSNQGCIASGNTSATFSAVAGQTYYFSVDGFNGAAGAYTLSVSCVLPPQQGNCCDATQAAGCTNSDCEDCVCAADSFCCATAWDSACVAAAEDECFGDCGCVQLCGDGMCDAAEGENCSTCAADCGCAAGLSCMEGQCIDTSAQCSEPQGMIQCGVPIQGSTIGLTNVISSYNCVSWNESGPEAVYEFVSPVTGSISYSVTPAFSPDLDVFILSPGCNNQACVSFAGSSGSFQAVAGQTYYVVVDGFAGAQGNFTLSLACPAVCDPATACNGLECGSVTCNGEQLNCGSCPAGEQCVTNQCLAAESCEGRCGTFSSAFDCQCDSSCFTFGDCCGDICDNCPQFSLQCNCGDGVCDPTVGETCSNCAIDCGCTGGTTCSGGQCVQPPQCNIEGAIDCSTGAVQGNTSGGQNVLFGYSCTTWTENGPEDVYSFQVPVATQVTAALSGLGGVDLDLLILSNACSASSCVANGDNNASFTAQPGITYYVVVDGFGTAAGAYTLTLTCGN